MRLHRLRVTAFGPFAATTEIDFDELSSDGLFLLHGPTGSGKTTILDAVAFALYGRVAGVRQESKRLHSDHAPAAAVPQVELEATIAGRRLRLVRSPEFERPKRRGPGVRKENPKATLTWLDGSGPALAGMVEVGEKVGELLGMSADQFFQVVLLPQGDFARFLRAGTDERAALLEKLFSTARFGIAEEWLARRRRELGAQLQEHSHAADRIAAQVCAIAGAADADTDDLVDWSQGLLLLARERVSVAEASYAHCQVAAATAAAAVEHEGEQARLRERAAEARATLRAGEEAAAAHALLRTELTQARRAEPVAAALEHAGEARTAAVTARAAVQSAAKLLAATPGGGDAAHDDSDLDCAMLEWSASAGELDSSSADAAQARALGADIENGEALAAELAARVAAAAATASTVDADRAALEQQLASARAAESALPGATAAAQRAASALAAGQQLAACRSELDAAEAERRTQRDAHARARTALLDARERRLAGMAAELAGQLTPGEPCTVCGSAEHPAPATAGAETVSAAQERAAAQAEKDATEALSRAEQAVTALQAQAQRLAGQGGEGELTTLAAQAEQTAAEQARLHTLAAAVPGLAAQLAELISAAAERDATRQAASEQLSALRAQLASQLSQREELLARLAQVLGPDSSVAARRARLEALISAATTLRNARTAATTATETAESHAAHAAALATAAGFGCRDDATVARRTPERQQAIETELTAAEAARAGAVAVLAEPTVMAATESEPADVAALETAASAAAGRFNTAVGERASAAQALAQLEELCAQLWAAADHLGPLRQRHRELAELADIVAGRGANNRGMSLHSYVLAERLEEVLHAATLRLRQMSSGRYEFVHSDQRGPRGRRGGLGIDIRDGYTGCVRPANTLSGGETFIAALALALGLADTVAAQSGGLLMDTMFIDEGFGSLDADALDSVMGVLDELRAGGRVVGIVSHVDDLRQRIPTRLRVIRGQSGSRLELVS